MNKIYILPILFVAANIYAAGMGQEPKSCPYISRIDAAKEWVRGNFKKLQEMADFAQKQVGKAIDVASEAAKPFVDAGKQLIRTSYERQVCAPIQATIRQSPELNKAENKFLAARLPVVKDALGKILGEGYTNLKDEEVPRIAFCSSGGGYRAMISTLGSFVGASNWSKEGAGLLDAVTYNAGLSGSTWAIAGWLQSHLATPADYLKALSNRLGTDLYKIDSSELPNIVQGLVRKVSFDEPLSLIDIYGALLYQKLLKGLAHEYPVLGAQTTIVGTGKVPMPIYTSVIGEIKPYQWMEFTPYEVGSTFQNAYVPTWAFGRSFNGGKSQDFAPPQSLGYCMGIWGSAFSAHARDIYGHIIREAPDIFRNYLIQTGMPPAAASELATLMTELIKKYEATSEFKGVIEHPRLHTRIYPAEILNWTYGVKDAPLNNQKTLILVDAGIHINLPFVPLLRKERKVDIIIVFDAGTGEPGAHLNLTEDHAKLQGLKFPEIDKSTVGQICSVHRGKDPEAPIVIYLPLIGNPAYKSGWIPKNSPFTGTTNFVYKPEEIDLLSGLTEFNLRSSQSLIVDTIKQWIDRKRKQ